MPRAGSDVSVRVGESGGAGDNVKGMDALVAVGMPEGVSIRDRSVAGVWVTIDNCVVAVGRTFCAAGVTVGFCVFPKTSGKTITPPIKHVASTIRTTGSGI